MNAYIEIRHRFFGAWCGVMPASLMVLGAMLGFPFLRGWARLVLPVSMIGTVGLIWGVIGVQLRYRWWVVGMLAIGEAAMLWAVVPIVSPPPMEPMWLHLFACWLTLGPTVVGAELIFRLCRGRAHQEGVP